MRLKMKMERDSIRFIARVKYTTTRTKEPKKKDQPLFLPLLSGEVVKWKGKGGGSNKPCGVKETKERTIRAIEQ